MRFAQVKLKEVANLITKGTTPTTIGLAFARSGIPFLRVQNLQNGEVDVGADPLYISPETHQALRRSVIRPGDVLVSIAGTIGRVAIVDCCAPEMNCNQAVAVIRPAERLDPLFLKHWLQSDSAQKQMFDGQVTGTITNLSLTQISDLEIELPPKEEQRRIAAILDKADALRDKHLRGIEIVDRLKQSLRQRAFRGEL